MVINCTYAKFNRLFYWSVTTGEKTGLTEYSNSCLLLKIVEFDPIYKVAVVHVNLEFFFRKSIKYIFRKFSQNGKIVEIKTHETKSGSSGRKESSKSFEKTQRQFS